VELKGGNDFGYRRMPTVGAKKRTYKKERRTRVKRREAGVIVFVIDRIESIGRQPRDRSRG